MAENRKVSKENQTRWIFKDSMVEDFIEALEASKTEYESRGLDFERDLVNHNCVRQCQRNTRKQILVQLQ